MKIELELYHATEYMTQEDWNRNPCSKKWIEDNWVWGTYQPQAYSEPTKFPCIAIENEVSFNPNGALSDWQHYAFLYDYKVL